MSDVSNEKKVLIKASPEAVWKWLVEPGKIQQYFFGVRSTGEWKKGNTIVTQGDWQGKKFEGKSELLEVQPPILLKHTYWSSMSGQPDQPSNRHIITYHLARQGADTQLSLTEENLADDKMKAQSSKLWDQVLEKLKTLAEEEASQSA
jgi:uncharacterized protein YndB with AHSA1/START domain